MKERNLENEEIFVLVGFTKPNGDFRQMLIKESGHLDDVRNGDCEKGDWSYYLVPGCTEVEELTRVTISGQSVYLMDNQYYTDY